jgi:hypothetical protein
VFSALLNIARLLIRPEWIRRHHPNARVRQGKFAGENTESVVVFLVGVRINIWWKARYWLPLLLAMPTMLRELVTAPGSGLLGYRLLVGPGPRQAMLVQYWSGPEELRAFAEDRTGSHRSAQRRFWRHYADCGGAVGFWREIFVVEQGAHHSLYGNMPPAGIGGLYGVREAAWAMSPNSSAYR